jgi:hypothetical protein
VEHDVDGDGADVVFLTLPMGAFDGEGDGEIRFRIPRSRR